MNEQPTNDVVLEAPVTETTVEAPKEYDGLSNREALEKAIEKHREGKEEAPAEPTKQEVKQAVEAEIEPPSEFSAAAKQAWRNKDIAAIQREYKRLHDSRTAEIIRAQHAERAAREEVKATKDLANRVKDYLKIRGEENLPDEAKIAQALQLVDEIRKQNPDAIRAELKKLGVDLSAPSSAASDPKIEALHSTVEELKRERDEAKFHQIESAFGNVFDQLAVEKTRTGEPVFPDLNNSEEGIELARDIGSLTKDPRFQSRILRRFPDADLKILVREAYRALGGRVSGEAVRVSTETNQQHTHKARRAAAAVPGRTAPRVNDSNLVGKLSNRAALAKALELARER